MKNIILIMGIAMATPTLADVPLVIAEDGAYSFEAKVTQGDETLCEIVLEVSDTSKIFEQTGCRINPADRSGISISGSFKGEYASGSFDASYTFFDVSPWTGVLRDPSLDFGTRLDRYRESLLALDADVTSWFRITTRDIPEADIIKAVRQDVGTDLPSELHAFVTRDMIVEDHSYIGPAFQMRRPGGKPSWPSLSEREIGQGVPESALPAKDTELRNWYDRVRVVFENVGDGVAPIVWDPEAGIGQPDFFWLHEEDREATPLLYLDGTPVSALDALLAPLDWAKIWDGQREDRSGWVYRAVATQGVDADDPGLIIVDTSNPNTVLSFNFDQGSNVPFFKTVEPYLASVNQTWWER